nr:hypothetical protein [Tanacetum cinerariifolium]
PKVIAPGMFKLSVSQSVSPISMSKTFCDSKNVKNLDTFGSVRRPKHSGVIWKKKGSSNISNVDLSSVSSAYVCNDAMNVSCNSRICDLFDENNLFIFDDKSVRISPVSKMPFRKKLCVSMNVRSESNHALLTNFMEKFLRMVRFGNNDFAVIAGYGDVGLEVAFRKSTCFVRNEYGVDLLTDDQSSNLYTIDLNEVASNSSTCLLAKASSSQSWLWHQRLSHLNFATINNLVKNNLVQGISKMKLEKDHLCSMCEQGKIHRKHHKSKTVFASNKPLYLLHMDLCGPMRVESTNGKRYVLVVVDDYSRYTWRVQTYNGTEFKNKTLAKFFDEVGISQQYSVERTPQQNGVVERRNRTLVEAARTMLTFVNLSLFLWAEAIAKAYFTQNRSIIYKRFDKTPYELMNKRKPNIKFFHVFKCRCYLLNDYEDVGKIKAKRDIGVFVGYSKESAAFRIYNKRTRKIHESVNIMKSSTTNVETSNVEIPLLGKEVFHEVSESFQVESSSSSLNDDVQQSPEEVILPSSNTQ